MTEAETLRTAMRAALATLDAGGPVNIEDARKLLREGLRIPGEAAANPRPFDDRCCHKTRGLGAPCPVGRACPYDKPAPACAGKPWVHSYSRGERGE